MYRLDGYNKFNKETVMNLRKFKLYAVSKVFGKALATFYKVYVYNCNLKNFSKVGKHITLARPLFIQPEFIELESYTRIQQNVRTIISHRQKVIIKKYSAIGAGATIIPGNHTPTVTVPQYLSYLGINDVDNTLTIHEDVWIGANSTLLSKGEIGRGAVVAANSVVTKKVPPYAVVSGIPAKVIAVRFTMEQIIEHEKSLYPQEERLTEEYLSELFSTYFKDKRCIGTKLKSEADKILLNSEKSRLGVLVYTTSEKSDGNS